MAKFEIGAYAEVIDTGRIGQVVERERRTVWLRFADRVSIQEDICDFKDSELKVIELPRLKTSQLRPLVRGEITVKELTKGVNLLPEGVEADTKAYEITAVDLLTGLEKYIEMSPEDVYRWFDVLIFHSDDMAFPYCYWKEIKDSVTEKDVLAQAFHEITDLYDMIFDRALREEKKFKEQKTLIEGLIKPGKKGSAGGNDFLVRAFNEYANLYDMLFYEAILKKEDFNDLKDLLEIWIKSGGRDYSDSIKHKIAAQYDSDNIDKQSEKTQKLFKACLDYDCDVKRDPKSIQRRGYCYYSGTKVYPNDWIKARDAFIDYYHLTGDASAANTLGYIYYYGRCNGGEPEYEEAFKYFSIGHAYTYFESTYKLADMLAHGYGVVKDGDSANHLYWSVYNQNHFRFIRGDFESKFADAALRIGNCYRDGIGTMKSLEKAYRYYLQADYAIRKRIAMANHYGDTVVFNGIQKALFDVRAEYTEKGRVEKFEYPVWTKWALIEHRRCKITIKELKNGVLGLDVSPLKRRDEEKAPMMLITVPKADYCELKKKIRIKTAQESEFKTVSGKPEIVFDSIEYDWDERKTTFYLYDDVVGEIVTDNYLFTAPAKKKVELTGNIYHVVSITFENSGRTYDYLCDDETVAEGDLVVVNGYDGEKTVKVVAVRDRYESELCLPLERFKKIVRKA